MFELTDYSCVMFICFFVLCKLLCNSVLLLGYLLNGSREDGIINKFEVLNYQVLKTGDSCLLPMCVLKTIGIQKVPAAV